MKKSALLFILFIGVLVLSACTSEETDSEADGAEYTNAHLLVDVEWVEDNLDNDNIRFVDLRRSGYEGGHIPGAVQLSSGELNNPDSDVSGMIATAEQFEEIMSALGISNDTLVVAYDDGDSLSAARLFYALEYYGHEEQVKILNGGFTAWLASGNDVSTVAPTVEAASFIAVPNDHLAVDKDFVLENLENEFCTILDVRSPEEYSGENVRADRGGHIPSAVNLNWTDSIEEVDGLPSFKSQADLEVLFDTVGVSKDKMIIPYCQTNVRGAHTYFVLRLLGFEDVRPYEGSWAEWGNLEDTPVVN